MTFRISDDRFQQLLQIEESVNCDIGAGIDHGTNLRAYLAEVTQYVDHTSSKSTSISNNIDRPKSLPCPN
jgi:hypothetical protein